MLLWACRELNSWAASTVLRLLQATLSDRRWHSEAVWSSIVHLSVCFFCLRIQASSSQVLCMYSSHLQSWQWLPLPYKIWCVGKLSENSFLVKRFSWLLSQNANLKLKHLGAKFKFWAPIIFSVGNMQCLTETCCFLLCLQSPTVNVLGFLTLSGGCLFANCTRQDVSRLFAGTLFTWRVINVWRNYLPDTVFFSTHLVSNSCQLLCSSVRPSVRLSRYS